MAVQIKIAERKNGDKVKPPVHGSNKASGPGLNPSYTDWVLHLQRTIGNREVTRLIRSGVIRTKLSIGRPGDIYEKEADRIADQVMRMPEGCHECREKEKEISRPGVSVDLRQVNMFMNLQAANRNRSIIAQCTIDGPSDIIRRLQLSKKDIKEDKKDFNLTLPMNLLNIGLLEPGLSPFVKKNEQYLFPQLLPGYFTYPHNFSKNNFGFDVYNIQPGISPFPFRNSPFLNFPFFLDGIFTTQSGQGIGNPLGDMSTFQSPGASGWRGAIFGCYRDSCTKKHEGWDIYAAVGTECKAVVDGTITNAQQPSGAGNYVILTSASDTTKKYYYMHLDSTEQNGQVTKGKKVGNVGVSGNANSARPHLHFAVKENGTYVDPDGKGFSKPTSVRSASGVVTTINYSEQEPCTPC